jgi:hypothetical protein
MRMLANRDVVNIGKETLGGKSNNFGILEVILVIFLTQFSFGYVHFIIELYVYTC